MKKYPDLLADIVLNVKKEEISDHLDAFISLLEQEGALLNIEAIIKEAESKALRQIEEKTVVLRMSQAGGDEARVLREKLGDNFFVEELLDNSLVSGVAIDFAGHRIDGSLSGHLKSLTVQMKN